MSIWDLCIRRPVFTVMLVPAPIVLGALAYSRMGVDLLPRVDLAMVTVTTTLTGASVEEMETSVTKPLEEIINTVSGIDELRSTTKEGVSTIIAMFVVEKDRDVAAQEVRDKISTVLYKLPVGTDQPIIDKLDLNASPIMQIAVSGPRPMQEITEIARKQIKENLNGMPGVGDVILVGSRQRAVNVYVNTDKLAAHRLSIAEVRQALVSQNLEMPGGRIDQGAQELILRTMGRMEKTSDFNDLIVANQNGHPLRIRDLGRVEDSFEEPRSLARLDGENAVNLIVQKQSGANTIEVVEAVKKRLGELGALLPGDIRTFVVKDQSKFIKRSFEEVQFHLIIAAILVAATILLFLGDWRTTIIAGLAIPASIIATFAFMKALGYTLDNMTMLALVLAIGIVIDDAVVINENVFRHMEEHGRPAREAAAHGTREIALAVSATTLSLLVIFLPVVFMGGRIGRFFSSFGGTVAFAILMSWCISFTLTPMLCSRFLKRKGGGKGGHEGSKSSRLWRWIDAAYAAMLRWSLRRRWVVVVACIGLLAVTPLLFRIVGFDFLPRDDQSELEVAIIMPEGYTLDRADRLFAELEGRLRKLRGVETVFTTIGDTTGRMTRGQGDVTMGTIYLRLTDLDKRQRPSYDPSFWLNAVAGRPETDPRYFTQFDVQREAREVMKDYPELRVSVQDVAMVSVSGMRQAMFELNLRGPDLDELQTYSGKIADYMKSRPGFVDVDTSISLRKPELQVHPDRERASDLGVSMQTIAATLNVLVGGDPVTKYKEADEQYDVWLRAELPFRDRQEMVERLTVPSTKPGVGLVELASVARLEPDKGPASIDRYRMQRDVVVTANLERGCVLSEMVQDVDRQAAAISPPADYHWEFAGQAKIMGESQHNFGIAFVLSFIFMYMVLAAQFESFVQPITILLALPMTLPFALVSLMFLRTSLDIYAMFGLFMLFGIVKKNGILQIDFTNVLRRRGIPRDQAILQANRTRFRPILMTTVMLIAAMIPIAMGRGPGSGSRASLAKVILGGQTLSLLLTLLVTPVAYSLWDDLAQFFWRLLGRVPDAGEPAFAEAGGQTFVPVADDPEPAEAAVSPAGSNGDGDAAGDVV